MHCNIKLQDISDASRDFVSIFPLCDDGCGCPVPTTSHVYEYVCIKIINVNVQMHPNYELIKFIHGKVKKIYIDIHKIERNVHQPIHFQW